MPSLHQWRRSCPTPVGVGRFVIRATRERGVGVPPSRSLATASREAHQLYVVGPLSGLNCYRGAGQGVETALTSDFRRGVVSDLLAR